MVLLFWEVVETLGSGVLLDEVGSLGEVNAFEGCIWSPVPSRSLFPVYYEVNSLLLYVPDVMLFCLITDPESMEPRAMD
jgi:hypothetical protein